MSKIEFKVTYDNDENPIKSILNFNRQIMEFIKAIIDFKQRQSPEEVLKQGPKQLLFHMGSLLVLEMFLKWFATMSLVIASGKQNKIQELDKYLKNFAEVLIEEIEENEDEEDEEK
jgi:hypothetical protein